jgi:hypothetical protein
MRPSDQPFGEQVKPAWKAEFSRDQIRVRLVVDVGKLHEF